MMLRGLLKEAHARVDRAPEKGPGPRRFPLGDAAALAPPPCRSVHDNACISARCRSAVARVITGVAHGSIVGELQVECSYSPASNAVALARATRRSRRANGRPISAVHELQLLAGRSDAISTQKKRLPRASLDRPREQQSESTCSSCTSERRGATAFAWQLRYVSPLRSRGGSHRRRVRPDSSSAAEAATRRSALRLLVSDTCSHEDVLALQCPRPHECGSRPTRRDVPAYRQKRVPRLLRTLPVEQRSGHEVFAAAAGVMRSPDLQRVAGRLWCGAVTPRSGSSRG